METARHEARQDPGTRPVVLVGADVGGTRARVRHRVVSARSRGGAGGDLVDGSGGRPAGPVLEGPGYNPHSTDAAALGGVLDLVAAAVAAGRAEAGPEGPSPVRVVVVLGVAGAGPARHAAVSRDVRAGLRERCALTEGDVHVENDMLTAFASADRGPDGIALLAGTGAAAVVVRGDRLVARTDGMGWLLGDEGSAVRIGREVLEAVAADLDDRGPATALTPDVLAHLGIRPAADEDVRQLLIAAVHALTPAAWGGLAPLAGDHPEDAVAAAVLRRAGRALLRTLDAARRAAPAGGEEVREVVLTGSVLSRSTVIAGLVADGLRERGLVGVPAASPVDGALLLAARRLAPPVTAPR